MGTFDPYHEWLGLPASQKPPNFYELLGLKPDERDPHVIEAAGLRVSEKLRNFQRGPHTEECIKLLNQVEKAVLTLTSEKSRFEYDAELEALAYETEFKEITEVEIPDDRETLQMERPAARLSAEQAAALLTAAVGTALLVLFVGVVLRGPGDESADLPGSVDQTSAVTAESETDQKNRAQSAGPATVSEPAIVDVEVSPRRATVEVFSGEGPVPLSPASDGSWRVTMDNPQDRTVTVTACCLGFRKSSTTVELKPEVNRRLTLRLTRETIEPGAVAQYGAGAPIEDVSLAPDQNRALLACSDGTVRLMDLNLGREIQQWNAHDGPVRAVVVTADGKSFLTGSTDRTVHLWRLSQSSPVYTTPPHEGPVEDLAFLPASGSVLSCSSVIDRATGRISGGVLRFWPVDDPTNVAQVRQPQATIFGADFLPGQNGVLVAVGSDGFVRYWDQVDQSLQASISAHDGAIRALAVSESAKLVATAGSDGRIRIWQGRRPSPARMTCKGRPQSLAFSPSGSLLLAGDDAGKLTVFRTDGEQVAVYDAHEQPVTSIAATSDGFAVTSSEDGRVGVWSLPRVLAKPDTLPSPTPVLTQEPLPIGHTTTIHDGALSSDARLLATGGSEQTFRLWNVPENRLHVKRPLDQASVRCVAFSPGDRYIAYGTDAETAVILSSEGEFQLQLEPDGAGEVLAVAFAPDLKRFFTAADNGTIFVWDLENGLAEEVLAGHFDSVRTLAVASDQRYLLSGSNDGTARLWDLKTFKEDHRFIGHQQAVIKVAFAPNDLFLTASTDETVRMWSDGREQDRISGVAETLRCAAFDQLGLTVAVGDESGLIHLWDLKSKTRKLTLKGHQLYPTSLQFSADGRRLLSVGRDGKVFLWDLDAAERNNQ